MLKIGLLGRFDLRLNDQSIEIASRPAQSLLAYLLLKPGAAHRREKLAGLLWPNATETNARGYLRQALWRIRKALEPGGRDYVIADDLTIAFDAGSTFWLDIAVLEKEVGTNSSINDLVQGVSVYQGELLPGFYSEWVDLERERLQAVFEKKMTVLLDRLVAEHRWANILEWGERWIALGHVPEPAYRALMTAHHGQGDRSSMAAVYQRCQETLRRELGVEPSEQTRALYVQLSTQEASDEGATAGVLVERRRRVASVTQSDLPRQLTSFVGREREMADLKRLLTSAASRMVTLTGVGGCGKTRLALQVSHDLLPQFLQGAWFVELATLADPALLPQTVATTLGLMDEPGRSHLAALTDSLRAKSALLILDNCEHLVEASASLAEALLRACPNLHILASSREALGIAGETIFQVPSLSIPDAQPALSPEVLLHYEAVRLFADRAAMAAPGFAVSTDNALALAQICRRLDGMPLAIELAAARVKMLSPEQIASRLNDRFRLLTGGSRTALPRQQTLRATMDWSYNLLAEAERTLFCRLSVFAGGWTLEAAEAVCGRVENSPAPLDVLDLLMQLVNKSLVVAEQTQREAARFRMLETIRQYAREKLVEREDGCDIRGQHLAYYLHLVERAEPELTGPAQVVWLNCLETELDNVRGALEWALECDVEGGLRLATTLARFWDGHDHSREGSDWLTRLLQRPEAPTRTQTWAKALAAQGTLLVTQGKFSAARAAAEASLEYFRGQHAAVAADPSCLVDPVDRAGEAQSLMIWGEVDFMQGDITLARPLLEQSLAVYRALGDKVGQADALSWLSLDHRDSTTARALMEESLALNRELGHIAGIANSLLGLAQQLYWDGNYAIPPILLVEALTLQRQLGSKSGLAWVMQNLGNLAFRQDDYERARSYYEESIALSEAAGQHDHWSIANLAYIAARQGQVAVASTQFAECIRSCHRARIVNGVIYCVEGLAMLALAQSQPERAVRLLSWADAMRETIGDSRPLVEQQTLDRDRAPLHAQIDPATLAAAEAEGRAMTLEQAIAYALA